MAKTAASPEDPIERFDQFISLHAETIPYFLARRLNLIKVLDEKQNDLQHAAAKTAERDLQPRLPAGGFKRKAGTEVDAVMDASDDCIALAQERLDVVSQMEEYFAKFSKELNEVYAELENLVGPSSPEYDSEPRRGSGVLQQTPRGSPGGSPSASRGLSPRSSSPSLVDEY